MPKKEIIVYDYVDDNFWMIRNMFLKRKKAYEKVEYEIIENNEWYLLVKIWWL
jgi:hypothetical protein